MNDRSVLNMEEDFFKIWTPDMAWLLGFIWADGCLKKRFGMGGGKKYLRYELTFGLKLTDIELLKEVKNLLDCPGNIGEYRTKEGYFICCLSVNSKKIVESLLDLGVVQRKSSFDLRFPEISKSYLRDFIRGYFDGDGSVTYDVKGRKTPRVRVAFLGTRKFILGLKKKVVGCTGIAKGNKVRRMHNYKTYSIQWSARKDVNKLYRWMYYNSGVPCLQRKKLCLGMVLDGT